MTRRALGAAARALATAGAAAALAVVWAHAGQHDHGEARAPEPHPDHQAPLHAPIGHEATEGVLLGRAAGEPTLRNASGCPASAPVREHRIVALAVEITLNRYLDHDPRGLMYALERDVERIRHEEEANRRARAGEGEPAVSIGLQGDAIQPLVVRVNQGECLRIHLRNDLVDATVGFEIQGVRLFLPAAARVATAADPAARAAPGESVELEWWVDEAEPEGTYSVQADADARDLGAHGLFAAVVVEPRGSLHLDPADGSPLASGWSAMIVPPEAPAFREFVFVYHEVGNERYRLLDARGRQVPQVDPFSGAYRPGARALNYRSEPFMNRMRLMLDVHGRFDESLVYSSYAFGDPATPIARSYVGEPVKQRLVHGGSEVFHVHHVHGGAVRWPRQPGIESSRFDLGLEKRPPLISASERLDAQAVGPSETFDLEHECGSGGCQQGAGDYLVHCHIAHHYFAGMWTIWRVYDTLQARGAGLDGMPPLRALPGREGAVAVAVTSDELIGSTVQHAGGAVEITADGLASWVEQQLPPRGVPRPDDAAVFDWVREGDRYLNEPESEATWPGFEADAPGTRPPLRFDPLTGRLAYPWLRPHLGERPPFAPNHGPAPHLEPARGGHDPPEPGTSGPSSVCPAGVEVRRFTIHAVSLPVPLNGRQGLVDPAGQLYVLQEDLQRLRDDPSAREPLVIRANAGEHCVDIVFKSELPDVRQNGFHSKVNIHAHFVQFDVQASDGLTAGFNYEQSVRPFTVEGERLVRDHAAGVVEIELGDADRFHVGALVGIGMEQGERFEVRRVVDVLPGVLVVDGPLEHAHQAGATVSSEFVRYRWFPDVQFGTAYFHDHVLGLSSWRHGLFGAIVAEPPGSSYHDPHTGEPVRSGTVVDVHTEARVSADVTGSFREMVLFVQDDVHLTRERTTTGGALNLRAEPLRGRTPETAFSVRVHGEPVTPVLEAVVGDPVVLRTLVAGTNELHTLSVAGHWFRLEPQHPGSRPVNVARIGISERADLIIPAAGGPQARAGDYLVRNGRLSKLREGAWGLLRVFEPGDEAGPRPLPGRSPAAAVPPSGGGVCPAGAPLRDAAVVALELPMPMTDGALGAALVPEHDRGAFAAGLRPPQPWVLHANVGDCIRVALTNELPNRAVALQVALLAADPAAPGAPEIGRTGGPVVGPGGTASYVFYADPEVGETVALMLDGADALGGPRLGLYGAVVVGPAGSRYSDPGTGRELEAATGWRVDVHPPDAPSYRSFTLFLQDEDPIIGTAVMPYNEHVQGVVGLNYARGGAGSADAAATPVLEAYPGDPLRLHVLVPSGEQVHVFALEGHRWPLEPGMPGGTIVGAQAVGPLEALVLRIEGGAGPAGAYAYGDRRAPYREAGLRGILRVLDPAAGESRLQPLPDPR